MIDDENDEDWFSQCHIESSCMAAGTVASGAVSRTNAATSLQNQQIYVCPFVSEQSCQSATFVQLMSVCFLMPIGQCYSVPQYGVYLTVTPSGNNTYVTSPSFVPNCDVFIQSSAAVPITQCFYLPVRSSVADIRF